MPATWTQSWTQDQPASSELDASDASRPGLPKAPPDRERLGRRTSLKEPCPMMPLVIIPNISRLRLGFIRSEARFFPLRQFFQCEAAAYVEVEASSAGGEQPHECTTLIQTAPQQDQPGLQVVFDVR